MNAPCLADRLVEYDATLQPQRTRLRQAISLVSLVCAAWHLVRAVAVRILEEELNERGQGPDGGQPCHVCGRYMESKGFKARRMLTFLGWVSWRRRIRTCSPACAIGQIVPSDEALEIVPYQQTSWEVQRVACLLAVVVPFALACEILSQLTGVSICPKTCWNWVQGWGALAVEQMQEHLKALAAGETPREDVLSDEEHALPFLLGADGVMVPFRPEAGTAQGKTRWREVKVGILARLKRTVSHTGKPVCRLVRRRLVAVLGTIDALQPRLWGEALRQGILTADCVVWLSDGGRGFWRLFRDQFASYAEGILDFYHAVQNVWKGAKAWLDGRTAKAHTWFAMARHRLRHGEADAVLDDLKAALNLEELPHQFGRHCHISLTT